MENFKFEPSFIDSMIQRFKVILREHELPDDVREAIEEMVEALELVQEEQNSNTNFDKEIDLVKKALEIAGKAITLYKLIEPWII